MSALDAPDTERSMGKRVLIASTLATAVVGPALLSAQKPAETPSFKAEKCYGIAKAERTTARRQATTRAAGSKRSGRDSKATHSKTHAASESTWHGEDTLAVNPRDDANEPRRSRVFLAHSCHKGVERPVCRAKA
jgi:uncharacterized membrane protein